MKYARVYLVVAGSFSLGFLAGASWLSRRWEDEPVNNEPIPAEGALKKPSIYASSSRPFGVPPAPQRRRTGQ